MIIDYKWYGSGIVISQGNSLVGSGVIAGAVLVFNTDTQKFQAYIGVGTSGDEDIDIQEIKKWGNKISKEEALGIFGNVEHNGFTLKKNYSIN